jgi:UDP-N-acetylmuramate dehydrogenase
MQIFKNHSLKTLNTFGFDVSADTYIRIEHEQDLTELKDRGLLKAGQFLVLGGGSNVLLQGDIKRPLLHMCITGIEVMHEDSEHCYVRIGAGENWHGLVEWALDHQLGGIENLSLIPGTVGAAPMQNIGAYGRELVEVFDQLEAYHIESGEIHSFDREQCEFGYRESVFKHKLKDRYIITRVWLRLNKIHSFSVSYGDVKKVLDEQYQGELNIRNISEAVCQIRRSKLPDPAEIGNSGSFFKNPVIPASQYEALKLRYPDIPGYPAGNNEVKVPAGWLIDHAGWKGKRIGQVGVHDKQALVLVHFGGGQGREVWQLARLIQDDIKAKYGITLQPEVNVIEG